MGDTKEFYYELEEGEQLSKAVVAAVAEAHDGGVLDHQWLTREDINTDALDRLFQENELKTTLQFERDSATATISTDGGGDRVIKIESPR